MLRLTRALNTTDGTLIPVSVMDRGMEQIVARGRSVAAHRYSIKTTDVQDVWYDGQQRLLKVELRGSDGSTIVHELKLTQSAQGLSQTFPDQYASCVRRRYDLTLGCGLGF